MSYTFYVAIDTGGAEPYLIEWLSRDSLAGVEPDKGSGLRCGNCTSNVSRIWELCLTAAGEQLGWLTWFEGSEPERILLRDLRGQSCGELIVLLEAAVDWGVEKIEELRKLNPENGWGSADGAVTYLWDIQRACEAHPKGTLELCY